MPKRNGRWLCSIVGCKQHAAYYIPRRVENGTLRRARFLCDAHASFEMFMVLRGHWYVTFKPIDEYEPYSQPGNTTLKH